MPTPEPKSDAWFDEFKRLNTQGSAPAAGPAPEPPPGRKGNPAAGPAPEPPPGRKETPAVSGSERRNHGRFEVDHADARLYKAGLLALIGLGRGNNLARAAIDVSESGARLLLHQRVTPGTKVRLKIAVEKYKEMVEAQAVVRWCFQSAKKKQDFFVGVQFVSLSSSEGRKLAAMRDWFTSPQYKAVKQGRTRPKDKPPEARPPK